MTYTYKTKPILSFCLKYPRNKFTVFCTRRDNMSPMLNNFSAYPEIVYMDAKCAANRAYLIYINSVIFFKHDNIIQQGAFNRFCRSRHQMLNLYVGLKYIV